MEHFVKIYGTILDSSIWSEADGTRLLWMAMLAMADSTGFVEASPSGLTRRANITQEQCRIGIEILEAPDPESKGKEYDGRRIKKVDRGWQLLNYMHYRDLRTEAQVRRAERQARWREGKKAREEAETKRLQSPPVDDVASQKVEGRGERGDRVAKATRAKPDRTWMTPIAELHAEILGGEMPCARHARTFAALLRRHPIETIARNQRHYLEALVSEGRQDFLDYAKFSQAFGTWDSPRSRRDRPTASTEGKDFSA